MKNKKSFAAAVLFPLLLCISLSACSFDGFVSGSGDAYISLENIPEYSGNPYVAVNGNTPFFDDSELVAQSFEKYSELDYLGRCGAAYACIGQDIMPDEDRGSIGQIKPSGWQTVKYDIVDGKYLYNRCHLIGFQLSGENANEKNLITGTRYMNVEGMLPFENMVADYVKETDNHVLYRVTPIFKDDNLLADGVLMEAQSVEDNGAEICFNVFVYNVQPGIVIDYTNGESRLESGAESTYADSEYILNTSTFKFHDVSCPLAQNIKESNKETFYGSRETLIEEGYTPCGKCSP